MKNFFEYVYTYMNSWGETSTLRIMGENADLAFASWFIATGAKLNLEGDYWLGDHVQLTNRLQMERSIDKLLMNATNEEIMQTATAYNNGNEPYWRLALDCFLAFELGIDPIDVPNWLGEIA